MNSVECSKLVQALSESGATSSAGTSWTDCLRRLDYWRDRLPGLQLFQTTFFLLHPAPGVNKLYDPLAETLDDGNRGRQARFASKGRTRRRSDDLGPQQEQLVMRVSNLRAGDESGGRAAGALRFFTVVKRRKKKQVQEDSQESSLPSSFSPASIDGNINSGNSTGRLHFD